MYAKASRGMPRLLRCDARCKLNYIFVLYAETNHTLIYMCDVCTMLAYILLLYTLEYLPRLSTLQIGPNTCPHCALLRFDGPTADGWGHTSHWGRSCHTLRFALCTIVQHAVLKLLQHGALRKSVSSCRVCYYSKPLFAVLMDQGFSVIHWQCPQCISLLSWFLLTTQCVPKVIRQPLKKYINQ